MPSNARFREYGRLAPERARYVSSWVDATLGYCFQIMEADDRTRLDQWLARWSDLVDFEVHHAITSADAAERVQALTTPYSGTETSPRRADI